MVGILEASNKYAAKATTIVVSKANNITVGPLKSILSQGTEDKTYMCHRHIFLDRQHHVICHKVW